MFLLVRTSFSNHKNLNFVQGKSIDFIVPPCKKSLISLLINRWDDSIMSVLINSASIYERSDKHSKLGKKRQTDVALCEQKRHGVQTGPCYRTHVYCVGSSGAAAGEPIDGRARGRTRASAPTPRVSVYLRSEHVPWRWQPIRYNYWTLTFHYITLTFRRFRQRNEHDTEWRIRQ